MVAELRVMVLLTSARSESFALEKALLGHQFYSTVKQQPQFSCASFLHCPFSTKNDYQNM